MSRVNLRARPDTLAGVPVTTAQIDALTSHIVSHLPPRWFARVLTDVFCDIYMLGVLDGKTRSQADAGLAPGGPNPSQGDGHGNG